MKLTDLLKDAYTEGMTLEDVEKALEDVNLPDDGSSEIERLNSLLSKSNSEAADFKKQLREKMTEEERKAKEDADKFSELQSRYDALVKKDQISTYKAQYLALGYDEKLAEETANAVADGDFTKVFANQKKHLSDVDKKIRESNLQTTPEPTGGSGKNMSADDIMKIKDPVERQAAIAANIDLFEKE